MSDQREAMRAACVRGDMPRLPPPTWDINTPVDTALGWTMLHTACYCGHQSLVVKLLAVGASRSPPIDPNTTDGDGRTPLCLAAYKGMEKVVRTLVARSDVDVNKACPLAIACRYAKMSVVVALLECPRVDVNLVHPTTGHQPLVGETALHVACEYRFREGVKVLLQVNGIDTQCKNHKGETPLDVATRRNCPDICNLLTNNTTRPQSSKPTTINTPKTINEVGRITENKRLGDSLTEMNERVLILEGKLQEKEKRIQILEAENYALKACLKRAEKNVLDMQIAKNKEHMELEAHITTLEEESANNLKTFCEEREFEQQRFHDLQHYTNHVMSHVEQREGMWCNILPENSNNNNCKQSQIRIVFGDLPSFDESVCVFCPLQMVVKIIISRKFGVEPTQQVIFIIGPRNNDSEELLMDSSRTLDDIQKQQQGNSSPNGVIVQIKVQMKSTASIQEKDLKVVSSLGVGSYGTVFKCIFLHNAATYSSSSETAPTFVAVKALHEIIRSESNDARFQQEALISASLRHPNIVRCLGTCITSTGSLWIISELMEMSLRQLLQRKDLTFMEVVAVSSGIAKGMAALHRRNFMHRDLSSNNVLLDSNGTPKITDFGVSRAIQGQIGCGSKPAPIGSFTNGAGTPIYLPPQMYTRHYGIQGDMWEFAVLLSELLLREVPSVTMPKSSAQVAEFMRLKRASLSPQEITEVDRLCDDIGDIPIAECLGRKITIISALHSEPKMNNVHRACVGLFSLIVESCLSILEMDRPSFPTIDKVLMTCAEIVFTNSRPSPTTTTTSTTTTSDSDVIGHITRCLANIAATSFPDRNHTEPTSAMSSS
ncbi:Protein tyrosine and serine/threonine kinase [Pelomyxa schiedti]|nr:Protein tyrosine and serine/threonine kinase [Pelomyxa schiedti]